MPRFSMRPWAASGAGWQTPEGALEVGGGAAVFPAGQTPNAWLYASEFSPNTWADGARLLGLTLTLDARSGDVLPPREGLGVGVVYAGSGYKNLADHTDQTAAPWDGDPATYYGDDSGTANMSVSVIADLGEPAEVGSVVMRFSCTSPTQHPAVHYSDDGTTWTAAVLGAIKTGLDETPITSDVTVAEAPKARYWRLAYVGRTKPKLYTFEVYGPGGAGVRASLAAISGTVARIEAGFTVGGTSVLGSSKVADVSGGSVTLGGPADMWGTGLTLADLKAGSFGVLVRRPDQLANEDTASARYVDAVIVTAWTDEEVRMSDRVAALQVNLIGKELTRGTAVAATTRLMAGQLQMQSQPESKKFEALGDLLPRDYRQISDSSEGSLGGDPTYDEIGLILASIIGKPQTTTLEEGVYQHVFYLDPRNPSGGQSYTTEYGDANGGERAAYVMFSEFGLKWSKKALDMSGKAIGRAVESRPSVTPGSDCVQTLTMGAATSFTLAFKGAKTSVQTTSGLTSTALQTALQALATVGTGNMTVTGTGPYTIKGAGTLAGQQLPLIEVADPVGGAAPTIAYGTSKGGYYTYPCVPILPGTGAFYCSNTPEGIAAGKLTRMTSGDLTIGNRYAGSWVFDDDQASWGQAVEQPMTFDTNVVIGADSVAQSMATDADNGTPVYCRLAYTGEPVKAGNPHKLIVDMCAKVSNKAAYKEEELIVAREFTLGAHYDDVVGYAAKFTLVNGVASY